MRLSITLEVGRWTLGEARAMTDWSDNAVRKLNNRREQKNLETARFVEEQKIKDAVGIPLWNEIKKRINDNLNALNSRFGSPVIVIQNDQLNAMALRNMLEGEVLEIAFEPVPGKITWTCRGKVSNGWYLTVTQNGNAEFQWGMGIPTSPDSIATEMLNSLLGI
jgi:hypothetical protein